ncbi:MAG: hypothetical protein MI923_03760, partial [Phycisphaerales bacterium]|nr:hypothetical protein [Phycisphaerales bacterium]
MAWPSKARPCLHPSAQHAHAFGLGMPPRRSRQPMVTKHSFTRSFADTCAFFHSCFREIIVYGVDRK